MEKLTMEEAQIIVATCSRRINPKRVSKEFDGPTVSPQLYEHLDEIIGLGAPPFAVPLKMRDDVTFVSDKADLANSLDRHWSANSSGVR
jgi:hypothetical protein